MTHTFCQERKRNSNLITNLLRPFQNQILLTDCLDDSCGGKIIEINEYYKTQFENAQGDLRHEDLLIRQMWGDLNKLSCY